MEHIGNRCQKYIQKYHKGAFMFAYEELQGKNRETGEKLQSMHIVLGIDLFSGVQVTAIAIEKLGGELVGSVNEHIASAFKRLSNTIGVKNLSSGAQGALGLNNHEIPLPPITLVYTDELTSPEQEVVDFSLLQGNRIKVVQEKKLYKSVFISYGGPDENIASLINRSLKNHGVTTWFFPDDSLPGQKLHRMMHLNVNSHDKVILVCSQSSLNRNGVLNELEKVLEKEAEQGGEEILIPITIDDYVFEEWNPPRSDIAQQIRNRVVKRINLEQQKSIDEVTNKILDVIKIP